MIGILLAAGFSRRFGDADKLLQPLQDGRSVACTSAANLIQVLPVSVAVIRKENSILAAELTQLGFYIVYCDDNETEMADSLTKAMRFLSRLTMPKDVLIALADMPFIQANTIDLIANTLNSNAGIVIPTYQGHRGHPVAFSASFCDELAELKGDEGARSIIRRHPQAVKLLATNDAGILRDIDTPEDLSREI